MSITEDMVYQALATVQDPELHQGIVELGLIYGVDLLNEENAVRVRMTLTSPGCPYGPTLVDAVKLVLEQLPGVARAEVKLLWDPPWDPARMASDEIKDKLGIW
jgi:metal-sulfur cluster biosynthetic enzyme